MPDTMTLDLSHLDADVRLRIEVAETQGWEVWHYASDDCAMLFRAGHFDRITEPVFVRGSGGKRVVPAPGVTVPQFLTDPAAWGALMKKERIGLWWEDNGDCWPMWWEPSGIAGVPRRVAGHHLVQHDQPGRAVCLAAVAKYGRDTSPYTDYGAPSSPVAQGEAQ